MDPAVSIIVPCYKLAHLLPQCVDSILKQDYKNFEVLIMDNCSPDNTPEIAASFNDPRVKHIRNETNLGHVRNFNKGIALARGKYVWVISADDLLRSPSALGRYVDVMERNPNVGFVFCRAVELHGGREGGIHSWSNCGESDCIWDDMTFFLRIIEADCIVMSSVMMRKECVDRIGAFPLDLSYSCDWYMWSMLAMHHGVAYLAEPMIFVRFHEDSLTSQYSREYARICAGDELSVLWRVTHEAELSQKPSLYDACHAALVRRAKWLLMAGLFGKGNRISATEFEEILNRRFQDLNDRQKVRVSVYTSLTEDVEKLRYADDPAIGLADEIGLYWDLCCQAELAGILSLRDTCKLVLAHRVSARLQPKGSSANSKLSEAEFDEMLQSRISCVKARKTIQALVYRYLGDQQYTRQEYADAATSYGLAFKACPGHSATAAKYLLLRMGTLGIRIRQCAGQVRKTRRQKAEPARV